MTRTFQDDDLLLWEVYVAAPRAGEGKGARIVFHCLTDPDRRARILEQDGDRTALERRIMEASEAELLDLLGTSQSLD